MATNLIIIWALFGLGVGAAVGYVALELRIRALTWKTQVDEAQQALATLHACPDCSSAWVEHWDTPDFPRAGKLLRLKACHHHHPPETSGIGMIEFDPDECPLSIEWMLP